MSAAPVPGPFVPRNEKQEKLLNSALRSGRVVTLGGHKVKVLEMHAGPPVSFTIQRVAQ